MEEARVIRDWLLCWFKVGPSIEVNVNTLWPIMAAHGRNMKRGNQD